MAAVAGAVAQHVGDGLLNLSDEVIVENGGDVFVMADGIMTLGIYAGDTPLGGKLGIRIDCAGSPLGVCTSSAVIGHSLSLGKADAAVVISRSCTLADAVATATANRVQSPKDVSSAVDFAREIPGVLGVVVIAGEKICAWGDLELTPIKAKKP